MDGDLKKLRVRFSGVGKGDKGGSQTSTIPPHENTALGRAQMNSGEEYDTAFAATIAAAAYAIAAREEKLAAQKKPILIEAPTTVPPVQSPIKRGESMQKPTGGSKISRWLSGKEPAEDDDEGPVNVSVRRPLKPAQRKPEGTTSDQKVPPKKAPSTVSQATSSHAGRNGDGTAGVTSIGGTGTKADAWEKAKLARIREEYDNMIKTIDEWETEKRMKAKFQKEQKEIELDKKRAKALEEYKQEMARINKITEGAKSMAKERKLKDDNKIKEKADKIRSTGKLPRTCACF